MKDLVGFSVIVQTYWRLKVDGSHSIFRGDIAPPDLDGRLHHLRPDKNSKCIIIAIVYLYFVMYKIIIRCLVAIYFS